MNRLNLIYHPATHNATFSDTCVDSSSTDKENTSGFFNSKAPRKRCVIYYAFSDEGNAGGFSNSKAQRECFAEHYDFSATNATVRDEETGFGYFGARYYDPTLLTSWTAVDPMADKYPSISPYAYCAWTRPTGGDEHRWIKYNIVNNPVKLVDPDGREIHIVGDKKYQAKVIALLNQLAKSGLAGKYLVSEALRSEKTFTFIQPRDNSSFEEDAINRNGKNGEISFILFDAYSSGTFDEANGGVEKTPLTTMAHELAHFVFPNNGHILKDNGYNGGPAGEVKAVEWENMVRADLGMPLRRKYAGMDVFGKEISPSKQYENFYTLTKKENYMQRPKDVGGFRASRENLKHISPYYAGGRIVNPPINSTECKFKL